MNLRKWVSYALMLTIVNVFSQDMSLSALLIDKSLIKNANAVLIVDDTKIELSSIDNVKHNYKRVVTILNKNGLSHIGAYISYDNSLNIKKLEAIIYDKLGNEIKKVRKSDFIDVSSVSGGSLYEDSRVKYLEYTPTEYPFTVEYSFETTSKNSGYIASWRPLEGYFISTKNSTYEIIHNNISQFNLKEKNFKNLDITNLSSDGVLKYEAKNIKAIKPESFSPPLREIGPRLLISLQNFHYEGYNGIADDWENLGKWMYNQLLVGRNQVSEKTKTDILNLVKGISDPIEKAKIVYKYVQDNTRYISVQEGIGGIQPIDALDVDNVKYGDCKGLTNYTKALMDIVGVESNYARVYGSSGYPISVDEEFISFVGQTNHVILNLPNDGNPIWLECTSQKVPFGHIANFTDDRDVFVITPEGGRIEHTKAYTSKENYLSTTAEIVFTENGGMSAEINSKSGGTQYDERLSYVIDSDQKDRDKYYKEYWDYINGLSLDAIEIKNDRDTIEILETIKASSPKYAVTAGEKLLINPNIFNRHTYIPPRYSERKLPFVIERGFYDLDEYIINLPKGYKLETGMQPEEITSQFGVYKASLEVISDTKVKYKRSLEFNKGEFNKEAYNDYRSFIRNIAKADKTSIVLNKSI